MTVNGEYPLLPSSFSITTSRPSRRSRATRSSIPGTSASNRIEHAVERGRPGELGPGPGASDLGVDLRLSSEVTQLGKERLERGGVVGLDVEPPFDRKRPVAGEPHPEVRPVVCEARFEDGGRESDRRRTRRLNSSCAPRGENRASAATGTSFGSRSSRARRTSNSAVARTARSRPLASTSISRSLRRDGLRSPSSAQVAAPDVVPCSVKAAVVGRAEREAASGQRIQRGDARGPAASTDRRRRCRAPRRQARHRPAGAKPRSRRAVRPRRVRARPRRP